MDSNSNQAAQNAEAQMPTASGDTPQRERSLQDVSSLILSENMQALVRADNPAAINIFMELENRDGAVDWRLNRNQDRLRDLCKLVRNLFWAFEEVEALADNEDKEKRKEEVKKPVWKVTKVCAKLAANEYVTAIYLVLTLYALFGPDIAASYGHTPLNPQNRALAVFSTIVLFLFLVELVINCLGVEGYIRSGRVFIDMIATFSMVGDSVIGVMLLDGMEFLQSSSFVALRGSRLTRILRIGGRSSKFTRFLRVTRSVQVLRLVPRLQDFMQRSTTELAFILWHKRVKHIFRYLDTRACGKLTDADIEFFNVAMLIEFPEKTERRPSVFNRLGSEVAKVRTSMGCTKTPAETSFPTLVADFIVSSTGKQAFGRCKEDINCMKESCAIVENAISRLTLKVCILVLALLLTVQFVETQRDDVSRLQGLYQADALAVSPDVSGDEVCQFLWNDYQFVQDAAGSKFLVAILDQQVYWQPNCMCCNDSAIKNSTMVADLTAIGGILASVMQSTGLEFHELPVEVVLGANGNARSAVLFDTRKSERASAVNSIGQTLTVVIMLSGLVVFFATDMKRLSNDNVLHPLWDLMDDMCSLKSIEVLSERTTDEEALGLLNARSMFEKHFSITPVPFVRRCAWVAKYQCQCRQIIPVAEELLQLRAAFDKLHMAMLSWSKYVPIILLKQLFEARIEATIGCTSSEVCVVFIAIHDFKGVTQDMKAHEVLDLMAGVLTGIYDALDNNGGTMLEFIGDEVLAVFNAPTKVVGYELNAVSAALEAQDLVKALGNRNLYLECSVNKAHVLAGNLGSPTRMKYGVLGDGVNLSARLKSLNTRYNTRLLVSYDALNFEGSEEAFVTRPVGNLILKGRTTPTRTFEVIAKRSQAPPRLVSGADKHIEAFSLFCARRFAEAKALFMEVHDLFWLADESYGVGDKVSLHFIALCDQFMEASPPDDWDGSEHLTKKAF